MTSSLIYLAAAAVMVLVVSRVIPAGRSFVVALLAVIVLYALLVVTPSGPAAVLHVVETAGQLFRHG